MPKKFSFFLDLIREKQLDEQIDSKYDFVENSIRIGSNFSQNRFSFNMAVEAGTTHNHISETDASFQRYSLSSNYSYNAGLSGSGYIAYDTSRDYEGLDRQKITYGLNLKSQIGKRSKLLLSARSSRQFEFENEKDHDFKLTLNHTLASRLKLLDQSIINADVWYSKRSNRHQDEGSSFRVAWTIPFNMPVGRKKNFGTVKGKVFDKMTQGTQITRRLTDRKGRFSFDALVPGKYIIKIKGAQLPAHHRLENEVFEIELSRGENKEMEIKVLPIKRTIKMLPSVPIVIEEE